MAAECANGWKGSQKTMNIENLILVNYCHPDCVPLKNIMRLSKEDAFAMAKKVELISFFAFGGGLGIDFEKIKAYNNYVYLFLIGRQLDMEKQNRKKE